MTEGFALPVGILFTAQPAGAGGVALRYLSPHAEEFLEHSAEELSRLFGERALPLIGTDVEAFYASALDSLAKRSPWRSQFGMRLPKSQRVRWFHINDFPREDHSDEFHLLGMIVDVTEAKRDHDELGGAYRSLSTHMENTPLAVIEWDHEMRVLRWSGQARTIFGYDAEEIVGKRPHEWNFVHVDDRERIGQVVYNLIGGRESRNIVSNRNYHRSGAVLECEWYNSAVTGDDGKLRTILSLVLDVTERRRVEAEKLRLELELAEVRKRESLAVLAGGIAHDFNNLLTMILGNAGLIRSASCMAEELEPLLDCIETATMRGAELCRKMTAYAGIDHGQRSRVDLHALVSDCRELIRSIVPPAVRIRLESKRAAGDDSAWSVRGDADQIRQLLLNLVSNAAEAVSPLSGCIEILVEERDFEQAALEQFRPLPSSLRGLVITVRDNGSGMSSDTQARAFEPFYSTKFTGRGLGLAAVHGIAHTHGASIRIESAPGEGTTVQVHFPLVKDMPASGAATRPALRDAGPGPGIDRPAPEKGRALVVDDERFIRELTASVIEDAGYDVETANDGFDGWAMLETNTDSWQLLVLDRVMPGIDGTTLFERVRAVRPMLPIIMMSGYHGKTTAERARLAGPTLELDKPFRLDQLIEAVRTVVAAADAPKSSSG